MKQKDLGLLAGVLVLSVIISLIIASAVFGGAGAHNQQAAVVDRITPDFPVSQVSPKYFNSQSIDPLQLIQIGNPNPNPFASTKNNGSS